MVQKFLEENSYKKDEIRQIVNKYPILMIKRIIKESLIFYSPLLKSIGNAIDNNIEVWVKSSAVKVKTNTDKYEIGVMLKCIGVNSDVTKGWVTNYFSPKN